VAGFVGTWFGWRTMYAAAAVMMVATAGLLRAILPVSRPDARIRYRELLSSLIPLARKLPALRQAAIMAGFAFGAFCAYWTALVSFWRGRLSLWCSDGRIARAGRCCGRAGCSCGRMALRPWLPAARIGMRVVDRDDRVWGCCGP
jgi:hypothetical protein